MAWRTTVAWRTRASRSLTEHPHSTKCLCELVQSRHAARMRWLSCVDYFVCPVCVCGRWSAASVVGGETMSNVWLTLCE